MKYISASLLWVAGVVIAKGFWSTLFCLCPAWAYYLVVEKFMIHFGVL